MGEDERIVELDGGQLDVIAAWYVGERELDDEVATRLRQLDDAGEDTHMKLAAAIRDAGRRWRHVHGRWPDYQQWPSESDSR